MICCGSGSGFGKVLVPVPGPVPDPDKFITLLQKQKQNAKNLVFPMSEAAYSQIAGLSFLTFYYIFILDQNPNPFPEPDPDQKPEPECIPVPLRQKVTVPGGPVATPAPQLWLAGLLKTVTKSHVDMLLFRYSVPVPYNV
jgi:hypothetical protein